MAGSVVGRSCGPGRNVDHDVVDHSKRDRPAEMTEVRDRWFPTRDRRDQRRSASGLSGAMKQKG